VYQNNGTVKGYFLSAFSAQYVPKLDISFVPLAYNGFAGVIASNAAEKSLYPTGMILYISRTSRQSTHHKQRWKSGKHPQPKWPDHQESCRRPAGGGSLGSRPHRKLPTWSAARPLDRRQVWAFPLRSWRGLHGRSWLVFGLIFFLSRRFTVRRIL
jgi:hypothetical protein